MSESSSISPKQLRANRRNARKSTGPRTAAGKDRASRNATTHGAFCRDLLLPGESEAELLELHRGIFTSLSPQDAMELELAERVAAAQWRLRRLRGAEREALASVGHRHNERTLGELLRVSRKAKLFELFDRFCMDESDADEQIGETLERADSAEEKAEPRTPAAALAADFADGANGVVERLGRYQQRLEQSVHRALRELRQLRKDRRELGELPPCPYLDEEQDAEDDASAGRAEMCQNVPPASGVQNEPISAATPASPDAAETCERRDEEIGRTMPPQIFHPTPLAPPDVPAGRDHPERS